MVSSHNEAVPEAVPSNDIFPNTEASNTNVTTVKEEEDDEEMSPSPRALLHDYPAPIDAHIKQEEDDVEMPPSPPPSPPPPSPPPSPPLPSPPPSPPPSPTHGPPEQPPNLEQVNEAQGIVVAAPNRGEVINDVLTNNNDDDDDAIMMGFTGTGNGNNVSKNIFL